jgi:hypothetical protein
MMQKPVFVPHPECSLASGDCFVEGRCLNNCLNTRGNVLNARLRAIEERQAQLERRIILLERRP